MVMSRSCAAKEAASRRWRSWGWTSTRCARASRRRSHPLGAAMASELLTQIDEAANALKKRTRLRPEVGVILGTGLGDFADALQAETVVPYAEIPHFPVSTVES